ncbi:DNA polymerase family A-domain-containing protein [Schizophyllum amplum]|uniref:Mitochondrial DNA polymerase catalytic subunit n=1 Tax=Schizophyllum amplum TaxID=97359 RepID=A0A550CHN5_9AGAR|nr:DNA polymerase family A-domain-containing protein [Auriculariopsis ampla]
MGVQLLSRSLHAQIFKNVSFPQPPRSYINIAHEHLSAHGLDPAQSSVLPNTSFTLPPLLGNTLDQHFHVMGAQASEPYLSFAKQFAEMDIPPVPESHEFEVRSGWTKYHYLPEGGSYSEHVEYPDEDMLAFDVETLPNIHMYPIMACAASPTAFYAWLSPWLLGETDDPEHLVPLGDPSRARVVVGHNVSYDRARIREEYELAQSRTRFLDTMSLHVAVKGMSSHQRPAWNKYKKEKEVLQQQKEEAIQAIEALLVQADSETEQERLRKLLDTLEMESTPAPAFTEDAEETLATSWQDVTSANSLRDVAKLHCGIEVSKEIRDDFMSSTRESILADVTDYLSYCAKDVATTHAVYRKVLPGFLEACPHPVSFAGILTMGSAFLTVDEGWKQYIQSAEGVFRKMEDGVKSKLHEMAENAKGLMETGAWKDDVWLSQLDWEPKIAGASRGVYPPEPKEALNTYPTWYATLLADPFSAKSLRNVVPFLLQLSCYNQPLQYSTRDRWHYARDFVDADGNTAISQLPSAEGLKSSYNLLSKKHAGALLESGVITAGRGKPLAMRVAVGPRDDSTREQLFRLAKQVLEQDNDVESDAWLRQLDWSPSVMENGKVKSKSSTKTKAPPVLWPKWYWEITKPKKDMPPGSMDLTVRNRLAPLLFHLSWLGHPLFHSREHGWVYRVPSAKLKDDEGSRRKPVSFYDPADDTLAQMVAVGDYTFFKLPHKDGDSANVGSPLSKTFMGHATNGTLSSPFNEAKEALTLSAMCSYWISSRDRIMNQMVVWQDEARARDLGFRDAAPGKQWGVIVPQVITMGTVTRRAIEKTWLTASNAKKNRVGSELKALVRAPPGYAIVGADVDSEELWISSCMGDAQFGVHGATALGWMTLEGTKSAGTDLHSKTASILGISRDQAKVFNYSRIYGAGMRHAVLLLLQANAGMKPEEAQKLAENLYASTKGKNTHRTDLFERKFWFGGSESFVFNKLEAIALSDQPETPALGCGVTHALVKEYLPTGFGADYMPSRINWVVQSSGVDYLHMLIVSMDHLIQKYDIKARYLISVHDELRYLVEEQDKYRAALALQIANCWTRCMFAYKLGMDDLPQGVAFFSAVDVDHVLRKEVDMPCVTPSQPHPIPPGESLNITKILRKTHGGSLWPGGRPMEDSATIPAGALADYKEPDCLTHRAKNAAFLQAQATSEFNEIKRLAKEVYGTKFEGGIGEQPGRGKRGRKTKKKLAVIGAGDNVDWSATVDHLIERQMALDQSARR